MKLSAVYWISKFCCVGSIRNADCHASRASSLLSILIASITTGGGCVFVVIAAGSTTTTPPIVGNHSLPSRALMPAGQRPPLHSTLSMPSLLLYAIDVTELILP